MDENVKETIPEERSAASAVVSEPDENGVRYYDLSAAARSGHAGASYGKKKIMGIPKGVFVFISIILVVVLFAAVSPKVAYTGGSTFTASLPGDDYIAVLYVEGTIQSANTDYFGNPTGYQHKWTLDAIDALIDDGNNRGIIIFVNSPGGGVYESDELYLKLEEYKERTGCPVYAYMGSMAASGGYYISAAADTIIANRNCWTGSIGVTVGSFLDFSGLLERYGVTVTTIDTGEFKSMGSNLREMSGDERAIWQSLVDEAYMQFVQIVADGRGMQIDEVKNLADGRIYSAQQALEVGLIDGIGSFDDAVRVMVNIYDLWDCEVVDLKPKRSGTSLWSLLYGAFGGQEKQMQAGGDLAVLMELAGRYSDPISYTCQALMQ